MKKKMLGLPAFSALRRLGKRVPSARWVNDVSTFFKMAKHHPDLIMCRKQPGVGKLFNLGSNLPWSDLLYFY